jgi:hypothetical protein
VPPPWIHPDAASITNIYYTLMGSDARLINHYYGDKRHL